MAKRFRIPFNAKDYPWDKSQVESLTISIEHWYNNWNYIATAEIGSSYCQCCKDFLYSSQPLGPCYNCPIKLHSRRTFCNNTPWIQCKTATTNIDKKDAYEKEYKFLVEILLGERKLYGETQ